MAKHPPAKMSAVLGRCRRTGRWRLGARSNVLAVLGSVRLDMRHSLVEGDEPDELKMKITVFFGSAVLILPEGAEVRPSGMSLLSAEWVDVPDHPVPSGLPTLQVEWTCVLGRVHVVTGSVLDKVAQEKAAADDDGNGDAGHGDQGDVGSDPWAADHRPDEISDPGPAAAAPVAEIVVDMGVVDSKPWSMSDFEQSELATEPAAGAPEESAPQLVEAWRTHDWGPGILQRDDEDEEGPAGAGTPEPGAGTPEPGAGTPEPEAGAPEESAPQLVEAWRTHDWGPGILQRDDEDDEEDDASAPAGASA